MAKIFQNKLIIAFGTFFMLLLLALPSILSLLKSGFFPTHDFIYVARIFEMNKALLDGQFPVRWSPDFRYGEPLFNFYAPLVYYLGAAIQNFNLTYLTTAKILFGLSFVLSGISMYMLSNKLYGKWGALIATVLFLYAPYRSVDVYVRGAMSEAWAFVFMPLIFLTAYNLNEKVSNRNIIFMAVSLAGLYFTHNIMTILFFPFFIGWVIYLIVKDRNKAFIKTAIISIILSVGLAATYLFPALSEKQFVQTAHLTEGYFDYTAHFVTLKEFIQPFWGYGASLWGPVDDLSLQLGLAHWAILAITGALYTFFFIKKKKGLPYLMLVLLFAEFVFSLFMQHNKSTFIWKMFPLLAFVQFPWRFMGVTVFIASLLGGAIGLLLKRKIGLILSLLVICAVVLTYINYFKPDMIYTDSVDLDYIGRTVLKVDDKMPKDYLPLWVKKTEPFYTQVIPTVVSGDSKIIEFDKRTSSATFVVNAKTESVIEVPITYFPGWKLKLNGQSQELMPTGERGLIRFKTGAGDNYFAELTFGNTPVRTVSNWVSLLSLASVVVIFTLKKELFTKKSV